MKNTSNGSFLNVPTMDPEICHQLPVENKDYDVLKKPSMSFDYSIWNIEYSEWY